MFSKIIKRLTYQKKSNPISEGGFTLIENIVAIIILLAVISFAFTISYNNTKHADLAKDQVVATFLVQDVFDYVIAQKKQNILGDDPSDWLDGFEDCQDNNGCSIDTSLALENAIRKCDGSGCKKLQQQTTGNFADIYGHSGEDTKFTRKVTIDEINQDNIEAVVTIDISWKSGFLTKNFSMSTNIFNTRY